MRGYHIPVLCVKKRIPCSGRHSSVSWAFESTPGQPTAFHLSPLCRRTRSSILTVQPGLRKATSFIPVILPLQPGNIPGTTTLIIVSRGNTKTQHFIHGLPGHTPGSSLRPFPPLEGILRPSNMPEALPGLQVSGMLHPHGGQLPQRWACCPREPAEFSLVKSHLKA